MILLVACSFDLRGQDTQGIWQPAAAPNAVARQDRWIQPRAYLSYELAPDALRTVLNRAPREFAQAAADQELSLPMPDGTFARFRIFESPIMAPELAAKFPEIQTFSGQGIDDPHATLRFDITPAGFHAQILSPRGAVYIDPALRGNARLHLTYYKRDFQREAAGFQCHVAENPVQRIEPAATGTVRSGDTLRTYRLAVAATGEYTDYFGGTVAEAMSAIVTAINRVNGIYEMELAVRFVLIANNDQIIYTNAATDPYSNFNAVAMLTQNQTTIDAVIGDANYDVGHVFSTGGGGVSFLGVICESGAKARTVTGLPDPVGDPFYVDYVCHEEGHAFGANHTFNGTGGNCGSNRNGPTAYEPGSGSTIMGYTGICAADDLQEYSDVMFHSASIDEIQTVVTAGGCEVRTPTGNSAPSVSAGADYTIPQNTPFVLTATGSDPDGHPLTFSWEERDLGSAQPVSSPDNGSSPIFRAYAPLSDPVRTFPRDVDMPQKGEKLPTTSRTLRFRVVARDNRAGGGGVTFDDMRITVAGAAGPFRVTSPDASSDWSGVGTVEWTVAGTDSTPVSAATVDILLSTNGGSTYSLVLAAGTPNDGSEEVLLPNITTSNARIKVQASDNIFFALSPGMFRITPFIPEPQVVFEQSALIAEDCSPVNGRLDPGEVVTVNFALRNAGTAAASNVVATLQPVGGLVPLSGAQDYGTIPAGSTNVARPFMFLATGTCGDTYSATLEITQSAYTPSTLTKTFLTGETTYFTNTFANSASISIPSRNAAYPYPSPIAVSGVSGRVAKVTVTLSRLTHTAVQDVDVLLVSPGGQTVLLMSDVGGTNPVSGVTLVFDDEASGSLSDTGAPVSGAYRPGNFGEGDTFSAPAPGGSYGASMAALNNQSANGTWSLYVFDDESTNSGRINVGWSMTLLTRVDAPCCGASSAPILAIADATVVEGNSGSTNARFAVTLSRSFGQAVSVNYATTNGSAVAGADYVAASGVLQFSPGETNRAINISVPGDTIVEGEKQFTVVLSDPINATLDRTSATGTILDDDIRVSATVVPGTGVQLSFNTLAGRSYRVERCQTLTVPIVWTPVAGAALVPGTGGAVQVVDTSVVGEPQLFYRVLELAQ